MRITRNSLDTTPGPGEWFTGAAYIDTVAAPSEPSPRARRLSRRSWPYRRGVYGILQTNFR